MKSPGICPRDSQAWFMICHKPQALWFITGEVKWLLLVQGREAGQGWAGSLVGQGALLHGRAEVSVSPISDSGHGAGHLSSPSLVLGILVRMRNLYREKGHCYIFLSLVCVLTRQVSPALEWIINYCGSLYNKCVFCKWEVSTLEAAWRTGSGAGGKAGVLETRWPGFQSSLSLSPDVWSWGSGRFTIWVSAVSTIQWECQFSRSLRAGASGNWRRDVYNSWLRQTWVDAQ